MTTPEEARKIADMLDYAVLPGAQTIRELANQVEALQVDADRYRWLRSQIGSLSAKGGLPFCAAGVYSDGKFSHNELLGFEQMDSEIDAARKAK